MIENTALQTILETGDDISIVCEIYDQDETPTTSGFDPANALKCYSAVSGITFAGETYTAMVSKFGRINRIITGESNTASVTFTNITREISAFEFATGFEGLIMVIRLISRSDATLANSQILFTGKCEKPTSGDRDSLTVKAVWILGGLDVQIPRRKYTKEDQEGRVETDDEFEGFNFMPQYGKTTYSVRNGKKRGGIAGFFGFKKTAVKTLAWSSYSELDSNMPVAEVFGVSQIMGQHIAYADVGTEIRLRTAFCEGPIEDLVNVRSTDDRMPLDAISYAELYGLVGSLNGPDDPGWGGTSGYFSRTAHIRGKVTNSLVEDVEPAPDIVGVVYGRLLTIPDGSGDWVTTETFSDDPAAIVRFILTSEDYYNLDANWIDDDAAYESWLFNREYIIDRSLTDFVFAKEG